MAVFNLRYLLSDLKYIPVSTEAPCYGCGHTDWCTTSADGTTVFCRRGGRDGGVKKFDKNGSPFFVYSPNGHRSPSNFSHPTSAPERACPEDLDRVNQDLLNLLPLSAEHRSGLRARGLSNDAIDSRGYRTLPLEGRDKLAQKLANTCGAQLCATVPGLYLKDGAWTLAGASGTLIPVRDVNNKIVSLKVRADGNGAPRYSTVSSSKHNGPGAGSHVHLPLFDGDRTKVRVTEGELKADIATELSGMMTLGLPGVTNYAQLVPLLSRLGATTVYISIDADANVKLPVARALEALAKAITEADLTACLEIWDAADGKGIDDLLAGGKQPDVLQGDAMWQAIASTVTTARKADPTPQYLGVIEAPDGLSTTHVTSARRPTLVSLAGHLRVRSVPEDVAVELLLPWAREHFQPKLPDAELETHVRGIYQRYGVGGGPRTNQRTGPILPNLEIRI